MIARVWQILRKPALGGLKISQKEFLAGFWYKRNIVRYTYARLHWLVPVLKGYGTTFRNP
jgi:hypothetical protein